PGVDLLAGGPGIAALLLLRSRRFVGLLAGATARPREGDQGDREEHGKHDGGQRAQQHSGRSCHSPGVSDGDRAVMERLAALEAEVKADAAASRGRKEAALAKVRAERATQVA